MNRWKVKVTDLPQGCCREAFFGELVQAMLYAQDQRKNRNYQVTVFRAEECRRTGRVSWVYQPVSPSHWEGVKAFS